MLPWQRDLCTIICSIAALLPCCIVQLDLVHFRSYWAKLKTIFPTLPECIDYRSSYTWSWITLTYKHFPYICLALRHKTKHKANTSALVGFMFRSQSYGCAGCKKYMDDCLYVYAIWCLCCVCAGWGGDEHLRPTVQHQPASHVWICRAGQPTR